jgi:hypothetical protein
MKNCAALLTAMALGMAGVAADAAAQAQLGLRIDSLSSMQWNGNTLFMEGPSHSYMRLPVTRITDVFPGPLKGTFAVLHSKGIGMLLGSSLVPGDGPIGFTEMMRSSRPDAWFACTPPSGSKVCKRIVELRVGDQVREVTRSAIAIRDFDVDIAGHIVVLYDDDRIALLTGGQPLVLEPGASLRAALARSRDTQRVFIDARGSEVTVYAGDVYRLELKTRKWSTYRFEKDKDALVRDAASRRILLEKRYSLEAQTP